jgi:hypothetical protein
MAAVEKELARYYRLSQALYDAIVVGGRGLHSSRFRLNASALCGIGGALRGCFRGV